MFGGLRRIAYRELRRMRAQRPGEDDQLACGNMPALECRLLTAHRFLRNNTVQLPCSDEFTTGSRRLDDRAADSARADVGTITERPGDRKKKRATIDACIATAPSPQHGFGKLGSAELKSPHARIA